MPEFDWRSPDAYRPIQDVTSPGFAWEFLRRSPDYRHDVKRRTRAPTHPARADDAFVRRWGLPFRGGPPPFRDRGAGGLVARGVRLHDLALARAA